MRQSAGQALAVRRDSPSWSDRNTNSRTIWARRPSRIAGTSTSGRWTSARRHQGLSFCDWEFEEVRRQAVALYDELSTRWTRLKVVYSGRGFHVHVFDGEAFRLTRRERSRIASRFARRYAIDEWVTSGEMRLIRLPYSLHGMVSRVVVPIPRGDVAKFRYNDPRAVPRF